MNYASTVGGGAMTMVVIRAEAKQARPAKARTRVLRQKAAAIKKRSSKALKKAA